MLDRIIEFASTHPLTDLTILVPVDFLFFAALDWLFFRRREDRLYAKADAELTKHERLVALEEKQERLAA